MRPRDAWCPSRVGARSVPGAPHVLPRATLSPPGKPKVTAWTTAPWVKRWAAGGRGARPPGARERLVQGKQEPRPVGALVPGSLGTAATRGPCSTDPARQAPPRFSARPGCGVRAPPPGTRSREPAAWEPAPPSLSHDARPWLLRLPRSLKAESPAHALSDTGVRDPVHTTSPAGKGCPRVPAIRGGAGRPEGAAEPPRCVRVTAEQSFDLPALPALPLRQARPRP